MPRPLCALLSLLVAASGCGADGNPAPSGPSWPGENWLANPGFEQERSAWSYREQSPHWGDFRVVESPVHTGVRAVHLRLQHGSTLPRRPVKVYGVVQELAFNHLPDLLGGYYRVDRWERSASATDLYLQVVVIAWPAASAGAAPENRQLRYYLAGLEQPPFLLSNAHIAFVSKGPPVLNRWQRFEISLRADFERLWGGAGEGYDKIEVLFEARWDNMPARSSVAADVYYDDLFVGNAAPASGVSRAPRE